MRADPSPSGACALCGRPIPGEPLGGEDGPAFCSNGCRRVHRTLVEDERDDALVADEEDDDLGAVERAFDLAGAARRRLGHNSALALLYNAITIPLAVVGLFNPLFVMAAVVLCGGLIAANSFRWLVEE